ncbi:MAG: hypothetical protein WAX77_07260 [Methylococcaceae bacterium]
MKSKAKELKLVDNLEKETLSKAQKKFNDLIKKIDSQKQLLQEWQDAKQQFLQVYANDYHPARLAYNEQRIQLVFVLDKLYGDKLFKKTDKAKLSELMSELIAAVLAQEDNLEPEKYEYLKAIYNRYNEVDFDSQEAQENELVGDIMKQMLEEQFDISFDESEELDSPEKLRAALEEKLRAKEEYHRQRQEKLGQRKKTAKQLAKEEAQKQEEQTTSKSIQAVYRQLAAAIHPDREPDETERERKTKLMQQVNAAYAKKDLLQLLALQLELEQIDQKQLNNIAETRLIHFNKVLQAQLKELQGEIEEIELTSKMQLDMPPFVKLSPKQLVKNIKEGVKEIHDATARLKKDVISFENPANLKAWLKGYK